MNSPVSTRPVSTDSADQPEVATCERCRQPVKIEPNGLFFCRACRRAWTALPVPR